MHTLTHTCIRCVHLPTRQQIYMHACANILKDTQNLWPRACAHTHTLSHGKQ